MTRVTVVGGGITGLAAAWELLQRGVDVTVLEASERLGGKIATQPIGGRPMDVGPDAFLARVSDAVDLCREVGLEDQLVSSATDQAAIWTGERLRPLPRGIVLGVPTELRSLARSGIVSGMGVARASLDLVLPRRGRRRHQDGDRSVAELVGSRLGNQVSERLVDPLLGGIHAGPSERLSARATVPQLAERAAQSRSLLRALRPHRRAAAPPGQWTDKPLFQSLQGGLGQLVDGLTEKLQAGGAAIELVAPVDSLPVPGSDATVLAVPAPAAARLLDERSPDAAADLGQIDHASVVLAILVYEEAAFPDPPEGSGFLVPRNQGRVMTACSFASSKWPHWAGEGEVVLRVSAGRWGDTRAMDMTDVEVVERLHNELVGILKLRDAPRRARVARWADSFPQYRVGHLDRVDRIEAALARDMPTVVVAGAPYRGIGIPACIAQGRAAAQRALSAARHAAIRQAATRQAAPLPAPAEPEPAEPAPAGPAFPPAASAWTAERPVPDGGHEEERGEPQS